MPLSSGSGKSASVISYYLGDHSNVRRSSLEEALNNESEEIVFIDDWICSGTQPRSTVQEWFGLAQDLPEPSLGRRLTNEEIQRLQIRKVCFRFAYGTEWGLTSLRRLLADDSIPIASDVEACIVESNPNPLRQFIGPELAEELQGFLTEVGLELLKSTKQKNNPEKWTDDVCAARAFGYGNKGLLVASSNNCPTSTITAIWKTGNYRGITWTPLFERREEAV